MNEKIKEIKKFESTPKVIKNLYNKEEIEEFLKLYKDLPTTVHNKKQNVIKKRWLQGYNEKLEKLFCERLKKEIGDFKMDNLQDENGKDIYGLIQESYAPIGLHVDAGFEIKNQIYKQLEFKLVTPTLSYGGVLSRLFYKIFIPDYLVFKWWETSREVIEEQDAKKEEPSKEDLELMKKLYDKLHHHFRGLIFLTILHRQKE